MADSISKRFAVAKKTNPKLSFSEFKQAQVPQKSEGRIALEAKQERITNPVGKIEKPKLREKYAGVSESFKI